MGTSGIEWLDWGAECYSGTWKGLIVPAAFGHPAKMSKNLLQRILDFGFAQGFWQKGDLLGDPFFGIGTLGILGAYAGLRVVGVELEPRFVALAWESFALHRHRWEKLGCPPPVCVQGDSRRFAEIVGQAAAVVTSPPWGDPARDTVSPELRVAIARKRGCSAADVRPGDPELDASRQQDYGTTPGQVGALPAGQPPTPDESEAT